MFRRSRGFLCSSTQYWLIWILNAFSANQLYFSLVHIILINSVTLFLQPSINLIKLVSWTSARVDSLITDSPLKSSVRLYKDNIYSSFVSITAALQNNCKKVDISLQANRLFHEWLIWNLLSVINTGHDASTAFTNAEFILHIYNWVSYISNIIFFFCWPCNRLQWSSVISASSCLFALNGNLLSSKDYVWNIIYLSELCDCSFKHEYFRNVQSIVR